MFWWRAQDDALAPAASSNNLADLLEIAKVLIDGGDMATTDAAVVCEHTRRLAEIVLQSEQRCIAATDDALDAAKCLEIFFSRGLVPKLCALAKNSTNNNGEMVQIQALQTLSIFAQSLKQDENFFHFLSQNHVNSVLAHDFFAHQEEEEEILAHYITLMKTLALRLTEDVVFFFFTQDGDSSFPLYDRAAGLVAHRDSLVRATARSVVLQVHLRCLSKCREYITHGSFFGKVYCPAVRESMLALARTLEAEGEQDKFFLQTIQSQLQDVMDDWSFVGDVLGTLDGGGEQERGDFIRLLVDPLLSTDDVLPPHVRMWMLAQCAATVPKAVIPHLLLSSSSLLLLLLLQAISSSSSSDELVVQAACTLCYLVVDYDCKDANANAWKSARSTNGETYPHDLVDAVLVALQCKISSSSSSLQLPRPVTVRLLAKLLVHCAFDSQRVVLSAVHLASLHACISHMAQRVLLAAAAGEEEDFSLVAAFEDEWHELKSHPPLQIHSILINPSSYLAHPPPSASNISNRQPVNAEERLQCELQILLLLRLSQVSLAHNTDHLLPSLGTADVVSVREGSHLDLRHCKKYFEVQAVGARNLFMVLVAGALLLVEPGTGQCVSVCPIHRVRVQPSNAMVDDPRVLVLLVKSRTRRIGLATTTTTGTAPSHEYRLSLRFESEPKSLFAKDHIERSARRAASNKLGRIRDMLQSFVVVVDAAVPPSPDNSAVGVVGS